MYMYMYIHVPNMDYRNSWLESAQVETTCICAMYVYMYIHMHVCAMFMVQETLEISSCSNDPDLYISRDGGVTWEAFVSTGISSWFHLPNFTLLCPSNGLLSSSGGYKEEEEGKRYSPGAGGLTVADHGGLMVAAKRITTRSSQWC